LREIADELAVSERLVEKELRAALMFCGVTQMSACCKEHAAPSHFWRD